MRAEELDLIDTSRDLENVLLEDLGWKNPINTEIIEDKSQGSPEEIHEELSEMCDTRNVEYLSALDLHLGYAPPHANFEDILGIKFEGATKITSQIYWQDVAEDERRRLENNIVANDLPPVLKWVDIEPEIHKPIDWEFDQLFATRAKILISAEPKTGKTYFTYQMTMSKLFGIPFLGKFDVRKTGPIMVIAGEDDPRETAIRYDRIQRATGVNLVAKNRDFHLWPAIGFKFNNLDHLDGLCRYIEDHKIKFVVADPLARLMYGDESKQYVMSEVIENINKLMDVTDATFALVHHMNKTTQNETRIHNRVRGSSDLVSWYTCAFFLSGNMVEGEVTCELEQRSSSKAPHRFGLRVVEQQSESAYGLGTFAMEAEFQEETHKGDRKRVQLKDIMTTAFEAIEKFGDKGATLDRIAIETEIARSTLRVAIEELESIGQVKFTKGRVFAVSPAVEEWSEEFYGG